MKNMRQKREKISEKILEKKLRLWVVSAGGICWKFTSPSFMSVPDRICLFWRARIAFVEVKTTGNKPTKRQAYVHELLRKLGFPVFVVDDYETFDLFKRWVNSGRRFFDPDEFDNAA